MSGVAHVPSDTPVLSSHITTFSIFQVLRNQIGAICEKRAVTMIASEATRARTWRARALRSTPQHPLRLRMPQRVRGHIPGRLVYVFQREAYVTVDALKNFMSVMTDTITRQVSEHVRRAMEAANSARPLPHFGYVPAPSCKPSHRLVLVSSFCYTEKEREASCSNRSGQPYSGAGDQVHHCFHSLCDALQANRLARRTRADFQALRGGLKLAVAYPGAPLPP